MLQPAMIDKPQFVPEGERPVDTEALKRQAIQHVVDSVMERRARRVRMPGNQYMPDPNILLGARELTALCAFRGLVGVNQPWTVETAMDYRKRQEHFRLDLTPNVEAGSVWVSVSSGKDQFTTRMGSFTARSDQEINSGSDLVEGKLLDDSEMGKADTLALLDHAIQTVALELGLQKNS